MHSFLQFENLKSAIPIKNAHFMSCAEGMIVVASTSHLNWVTRAGSMGIECEMCYTESASKVVQ